MIDGRTLRWGLLYRADGKRVWDRGSLEAEGDAVEFLAGRYLEMLELGASSIVSAFTTIGDAQRLPLVFH